MGSLGYILLAVIGLIAAKAISASTSSAVSSGVHGLDPKTGAKLFDSTNFNSLTQTIVQAPRVPATDLGNGQFWCPYPFKLYKDSHTGAMWCYNESQIPTQATALPNTLQPPENIIGSLPSQVLDLPAATVTAQIPVEPVGYTAYPGTLTIPDFVQAGDGTTIAPDVRAVNQTPTVTPDVPAAFIYSGSGV
jgi:hypothetical protein